MLIRDSRTVFPSFIKRVYANFETISPYCTVCTTCFLCTSIVPNFVHQDPGELLPALGLVLRRLRRLARRRARLRPPERGLPLPQCLRPAARVRREPEQEATTGAGVASRRRVRQGSGLRQGHGRHGVEARSKVRLLICWI